MAKNPPATETLTSVRPLLVRPGARFVCAGDGICCTDVHALGPLMRAEARRLRVIDPETVVRHPDLDAPVMSTRADGRCVYLAPRRCNLHARHGADAKPGGCRRFPFGLIATPRGGRVTTEHRCPCRTLGERPLLQAQDAEESLRDPAGRLWAEMHLPARIPIDARHRVSFATYEAIEARMLERLGAGDDVLDVLDAPALPRLRGGWRAAAHLLRAERDGTAYGEALAWFGDTLLAMLGQPRPLRDRPWRAGFDRAEKRAKRAAPPESLFADWVADRIWSFGWAELGPFDRARFELAARYSIARAMAERMAGEGGVRPDRAAAEAICVAELVGSGEPWDRIAAAMVTARPSAAKRRPRGVGTRRLHFGGEGRREPPL